MRTACLAKPGLRGPCKPSRRVYIHFPARSKSLRADRLPKSQAAFRAVCWRYIFPWPCCLSVLELTPVRTCGKADCIEKAEQEAERCRCSDTPGRRGEVKESFLGSCSGRIPARDTPGAGEEPFVRIHV